MTTWGHLERIGGSEDTTTVPPKVTLQDSECFVGRFAEPVKSPDSKFTHKTQTLVPCLFVSSTHFSVGKVDGKPNTFFIKDYSRNGTYLNNELVGPSRTVEFKDGAEISLLYKSKVRILYRFKEVADHVPVPSPKPVSALKEERDDQEESPRFASMRSQADSVEFALNKQIGLLQEEGRQHEARIQQQATRIEGLTNDLYRTSEKNAALEKQIAGLESERAELSERLSTNESHSAAVEARNQKLEEQVEETRADLRDLRMKNAQLAEDLQTKTAQLESRNALMESSNKTMTHEKNKWTKLENKYSAACEQLQAAQEEIERVKLASQTLQDILSDRDNTLVAARQRYDKLRGVLEAGRGAVQAREEAFHALRLQIASAAHLMTGLVDQSTSLAAQSSYFDELAASVEGDQEWSSQVSARDENTYAEEFSGSQLARGSPPHTSVQPLVGTPQGAAPPRTATGTVNGADSPSPSHHHAVHAADAQRLDIESEGASQGAAPTADSQLHTQALQTHTQVPGQVAGGRGCEKRKRSQDGEAEGSPKKLTSGKDRAVVLTRHTHTDGDDGEGMDVQVEARDESDSSGDEKEADGEDMQATQAPANYAHLFEDSDQEEEELEGQGRGKSGEMEGREGVEEALLAHEESVQVMEVDEAEVSVEVEVTDGGVVVEAEEGNSGIQETVTREVEVVELCSPPRTTTTSYSTSTTTVSFLSSPAPAPEAVAASVSASLPAPTPATAPKAPSVTCTDSDSEGEVSFDPSSALLDHVRGAPPSSQEHSGNGSAGGGAVNGSGVSGGSGEVAVSEQAQRESELGHGDEEEE